jgi:hypothetical protein
MGRSEEDRTLFWSESSAERKLSLAFCAMLLDGARAGDFLGPDVELTLTSDFDSTILAAYLNTLQRGRLGACAWKAYSRRTDDATAARPGRRNAMYLTTLNSLL